MSTLDGGEAQASIQELSSQLQTKSDDVDGLEARMAALEAVLEAATASAAQDDGRGADRYDCAFYLTNRHG